MSRHPRRDTEPELRLRRALHALGRRYRVQYRVPGMPRRTIDIAFPRQKVAVFVDGCFWHGCRAHRSYPKANDQFWRLKIDRNVERDRETNAQLEAAGWSVVRCWEHDPVLDAIARIENLLER